ncbi:unnamed protein product [Malus baccata var. baccata]
MEEREMERLKKQRENDEKIEREGEALSRTKRPYQWAMYDNWERLKQYYKGKREEVLSPLTTNDDTVLHVVAFAGRSDVLEFLISLVTTATNDDPRNLRNLRNALVLENSHGNTILHEVAASGNLKAAMLLVSHDNHTRRELIARRDADQDNEYEPDVDASSRRIVEIENKLGETPFYRAASYGHTKLVDFFNIQDVNIEHHLTRYVDRMSVLHIAVINQHFETAVWLLKKYPCLAKRREDNGFTSLQLLAQMPSAFQVYYRKSLWKMLIHKCISEDDNVDGDGDIESRWIPQLPTACLSKTLSRWPRVFSIVKQIKNEKSLSELTHLLVEKDYSWVESKKTEKDKTVSLVSLQKDSAAIGGDGRETKKYTIYNYTPLLIATSTGILPLVKKMFEVHPQAVEAHDIGNQQNILHMSIKHRQLHIFRLVKRSRSITSRLSSRIDSDGNTILHRAADMTYYSPDTQSVSGPALQLQEELRWMVRVRKIMPPHYMMHRNNMGMTAEELFNTEHAKLLKSAQTWIRGTAQSCSAVAALVATVVFAAAYTAPGGYSSGGAPVLRHSPFFTTFIITDVVSLISSLSSLVTFLSILTSPFEYKNFHQSLPLRLHLGFAFLFFSLVTTMLVFTATAVLLIHLDEDLTRSLLYVAAFLPVSVFGLIQLPLYAGFSHALIFLFKKVKKFIISFFPEGIENVVVVHCKAGMARTGVTIGSLLLFPKFFPTAEEAMNYYNHIRCIDGKTLVVPSKIRYIKCFEHILKHFNGETPPDRRAGKGLSRTKRPYQWAIDDNWERLKQYYKTNWEEVFNPLTTNDNTVLQVVASAERRDVLEFLISLVTTATNDPRELQHALVLKNGHENTFLHEAAKDMKEREKEREEDEKIERAGEALSRSKWPYKWAMHDNWEPLKQYYKRNWEEVFIPLTTNDDTVLHVVAYAGQSDVLEFLISLVTTATNDPRKLRHALVLENGHGNTILHEVVASGNLKAAMLLVSHDNSVRSELIARQDVDQTNEYERDVIDAWSRSIVEIENKLGETPIYRAASYGHTKLVDFFHKQNVNIERHFTRSGDRMSVLHIAVINQHFDTALWLLKKYPFLAKTREDDGFTSLQLLAKMPSAFQVYNRESLWKMLIHKCLSEDDSVDAAAPNQNGDIESRWIPQLPTACLSKKLTSK